MSDTADGRSGSERPIRFLADGQDMFGILTMPAVPVGDVGVILLGGGACTPSTGRNRFSVRLARRLAEVGIPVLRFDYHGVGESTGRVVRFSLNRPFTTDLLAAARVLERHGVHRLICVGRCFGARTALSTIRRLPELAGLAFISMPLHDFSAQDADLNVGRPRISGETVRGLLGGQRRRLHLRTLYYSLRSWARRPWALHAGGSDALTWVSGPVVQWLRLSVQRGVPLLFLYGTGEQYYREFLSASAGTVGSLLREAGSRVEIHVVDGPVHDLTTLAVQESLISRIQTWILSAVVPDTAQPVGAASP